PHRRGGRHPGPRRTHRGAPHDRSGRVRDRPRSLAGQHARSRPHPAPERLLPRRQRLAPRGRAALRRLEHPARHRPADVPDQRRAGRQADAWGPLLRAAARALPGGPRMTGLVYLLCLLVPLVCMAVLDRRFRLVLWRAPRRGAVVLAAGIGLFLLWDLAAIAVGHYRMGQSPLMTGILLGPELPLEELVFIAFLSYHALVLWGLVHLGLGRLGVGRVGAGRVGPRPGGRRSGLASAPPREVP